MISALCSLAFKSSQLRSAPVDLNLYLQPSVQTQFIASFLQTVKSNKIHLAETVICSEDFFLIYVLFAYQRCIFLVIDRNYVRLEFTSLCLRKAHWLA